MKTFQKWAFVLGAVCHAVCQGQVALPAPGPNAGAALTITGTVFDASGAPAPGVVLMVVPGGGLESRSDEAGKFAISWQPIQFDGTSPPTVNYLLVGRDLPRNFAAAVGIDGKTTNMDLHLQEGFTLSGSVLDNNGAPVKTATIRLSLTTGQMTSQLHPLLSAVDEQGVFTLGAIPKGQAYAVGASSPGYGVAGVPIVAAQTETASLRLPPIELKPADQRLEGQVIGPDDQPVAGARVHVAGGGQPPLNMVSDATGHFAFKVCEGLVRVNANLSASALAIRNTNGAAIPGAPQALTGNVQTRSGDLNVIVKLGVRQVGQTPTAMAQAQARRGTVREQAWTWEALWRWPQEHREVMTGLLALQLTGVLGVAAGIWWVTRARRN